MSPSWSRIAPAVSRTTRVCAYDRAGEDVPYVLVGHSTGGTYAMTCAARYPEQVAGMVLLDSSNPYESTAAGVTGGRGWPQAALERWLPRARRRV
jgi:pimeloyl-ACP methyl ester carboxylesterase